MTEHERGAAPRDPAGEPAVLGLAGLGRVVIRSILPLLREKPGQILLSSMVLLMLWGTHGRMEWLRYLVPGWRGPGSDPATRPRLLPWIAWDQELISFLAGTLLLVVVPVLIIKVGFRDSLADYGLALPPRGRRGAAVWVLVLLFLLALPTFWGFARNPDFQSVYPLYRGVSSWGELALYELSYLPFFVVVEFIFRGYLLFGLAGLEVAGRHRTKGVWTVPGYALLLQMLPYTAWHLGKPLPELWGTLAWGLATGAAVWAVRSIWPVVVAHWLLNVFMDSWIWAVELASRH